MLKMTQSSFRVHDFIYEPLDFAFDFPSGGLCSMGPSIHPVPVELCARHTLAVAATMNTARVVLLAVVRPSQQTW